MTELKGLGKAGKYGETAVPRRPYSEWKVKAKATLDHWRLERL